MRDRNLWSWHVVAGLVVLGLLGAHMIVMHLDDTIGLGNAVEGAPISWQNVIARGAELGTTVSYVLLLGFALFHGLYGLRNILLELGPGHTVGRLVSGGLALLGLALFALGSWAAWVAMGVARSGMGGVS